MKLLVAGATGFVGRSLCPALERAGHDVRRGARPGFDVDDEASVRAALRGRDAAYWLVHGLKRQSYAAWERSVAERFARVAREEGVRKLIYLGGIEPNGPSTPHLDSRKATGRALRTGSSDVVELRAGMIIGAGSESWILARDAAARLPGMLAPPWLSARQQPVAIDDVVAALVAALDLPGGIYDVPGPQTLTGKEIVTRTARLLGRRARFFPVPAFPRRVVAALAPYVSRADKSVARELFRGMGLDLVVEQPGIFARMPGHQRVPFDEAAARALAHDHVSLAARLVEGALRTWDAHR